MGFGVGARMTARPPSSVTRRTIESMTEPVRKTVLGLTPLAVVLALDLGLYADAKLQAKSGRPVVFSTGTFVVDTPEAWFIGSLLLWIVFVPLYLSSRNRRR